MNIEDKVKTGLMARGFDIDTQLNNRGLIGATIDETILALVKNHSVPHPAKNSLREHKHGKKY